MCGEGERQLLKIELEHTEELEIFDIVVDLPTIRANPLFGPASKPLEQFKKAILKNFDTISVN